MSLVKSHLSPNLLIIALAIALTITVAGLIGCATPETSPDKTLAGGAIGAGWGAGAGAIIGNQVGNPGPGVAIGAGFGLLNGAIQGAGFDTTESDLAKQQNELGELRAQNQFNRAQLLDIQDTLDHENGSVTPLVYQVYFDNDATNLRSGATANLEVVANSLKQNPHVHKIMVVGHTDDSGNPEYNMQLAESRARTVSAFLMSSGISADQIDVSTQGAKRPVASNSTPEGRQLNRRVDVIVPR